MPLATVGREITRGTVCRDRWRADVTVTCSDVLPLGARSALLVDIVWREPRPADAPSDPAHPPVELGFAPRGGTATGDIRFDAADGPKTKGFSGDAHVLLPIFGVAATAGAQADVVLTVTIEGEQRAALPLTVGTPAPALEIRAADATSAPPKTLALGAWTTLTAVTVPDTVGEVRWFASPVGRFELKADRGAAVEARAVVGVGERATIAALFTPASGGAPVLATHELELERSGATAEISGRVLDTIGLPVPAARVAVCAYSGAEAVFAESAADGTFKLAAPRIGECELVITSAGARTHVALAASADTPVDLGDVAIRLPVSLTGPVGDGAANAGTDVRRVQDRLQYLGRLTDADVAAEPIAVGAAAVAAPIPRLKTALYAHLRAITGEHQLELAAGGQLLRAFNAAPFAPLGRVALRGPVGSLPGAVPPPVPLNLAAEVQAVQDRLHQLGLLTGAAFGERVDLASAPASVREDVLGQTIQAIRQFERRAVSGSLKAVMPGDEGLRRLNDPYLYGRPALALMAGVGKDEENLAADVLAVQERLHELELLDHDAYLEERIADPSPGRVPEYAMPKTLVAIAALRTVILGEPDPTRAAIPLAGPALARLQQPPHAGRSGSVRLRDLAIEEDDRLHDVRAVQDRLLLLGFLDVVEWRRERVSLDHTELPPLAEFGETMVALGAFQDAVLDDGAPAQPVTLRVDSRPAPLALSGPVGSGQANAPADVRAVQDRLLALRFLADADHAREKVDPAQPVDAAKLTATFAAIGHVREHVLGRPPADPKKPWTALRELRPSDETCRLLDDPLSFGRFPLRLTGSVGRGGANHGADVRAVQDRLAELGLLAAADLKAERAPLAVAPIDLTTRPQTLKALETFRDDFLKTPRVPAVVEPRSLPLRALENPLLALPKLKITHPPVWPQPRRRAAGEPVAVDLANPRCGLRSALALTRSVGEGGDNDPGDVRRVQNRLRDLHYLSEADHATEAVRAGDRTVEFADVPAGAPPAAPGVRRAPRTRDAIEAWRAACGLAAGGTLELGELALRRLDDPRLPVPRTLNVAIQVRTGPPVAPAHNAAPDVRAIQDRLLELGLLDVPGYLGERVNPGAVAPAPLGATSGAALRSFQGRASGKPDGVVSPAGIAARALDDPTWETASITNPHADDAASGPDDTAALHANASLDREIKAIIAAIRIQEGGGAQGEVPAILRNGSRTPASFGTGQLVGPTGLEVLRGAPNADFARYYDLEQRELGHLADVVAAAHARYLAIFALVPAGLPAPAGAGWTEAALRAAIAAYQRVNLAAVAAATGLGATDIERMFRTAQFRRHLAAYVLAAPLPAGTPVAAPAGVTAAEHADRLAKTRRLVALSTLPGLLANADVRANIRALALSSNTPPPPPPPLPAIAYPPPDAPNPPGQSNVYAFLRVVIDNEHLNGFLTRALFASRYGQIVRNALTDASGLKVARILIRDNFNRVNGGAAGAALSRRNRARVVAHVHNTGLGGLAGLIANAAGFPSAYADSVLGHWVDPGP